MVLKFVTPLFGLYGEKFDGEQYFILFDTLQHYSLSEVKGGEWAGQERKEKEWRLPRRMRKNSF